MTIITFNPATLKAKKALDDKIMMEGCELMAVCEETIQRAAELINDFLNCDAVQAAIEAIKEVADNIAPPNTVKPIRPPKQTEKCKTMSAKKGYIPYRKEYFARSDC